MTRAIVVAALVLAVSCTRRPVESEAPQAKLIPTGLAVKKLRELLPSAETVACTMPVGRFRGSDMKDLKVDEREMSFVHPEKGRFGVTFSELTSVQLNRAGTWFEVALFSTAQEAPDREHFRFTWKTQDPAREAFELFEALRQKK